MYFLPQLGRPISFRWFLASSILLTIRDAYPSFSTAQFAGRSGLQADTRNNLPNLILLFLGEFRRARSRPRGAS